MPKGKTPSLIGSTLGRPTRVDVKRRSTCSRCGCDIVAGAVCFGIPQLGGAFANEGRYCQDCYAKILDQTEKDLKALRSI